ncbi:MAG: hypothetical protein PHE55_01215, partial [Methylococcaceae bacterium]|nr:hypothetical protein [Methylococcaceae bacterium]
MSFVWRKRWFLLLLPLLLAVTGWQIRIESDLNAFFTATDDEDSALLAGLLRSGELSRRYLIRVEPNTENETDPDRNEALSLFSARFIRQLSGLEGVQRVWPANEPPRDWIGAIQAYAPFHAGIYSLDPEREGQGLFDPVRLDKRAEGLKQALLSPQGGFIKPIAKRDPLLLSLNGFKNLQNPLAKQIKPDSTGSSLILQSSSPALDAEVQKRLQTAIRESFAALNGEAGGSFRLAMTGIPVFTVFAQGEISRDIALVSTLSTLGVALVFLLLFHSFSALHWMMLIQAASFALGTLATALVFGHVHSLTLALGASLIGICTDYPIHVLAHCAKHRGFSPLAAARLLWPSLVMGGLTTIVGYAALGLTGFPGLEQIAVFAAAGIAASLGLTRWVLPALLGKTSLHPAHLPGIVAWIGFCERRRYLLLGLFTLSIAASLLALPQLRWMDDLEKLAIDMSELKHQDEAIRSHFTGIEPGRFVVVQAKELETALQRSEAAER